MSIEEAVTLIMRDVCETDPADPNEADTVCINVVVLHKIVERHIRCAQPRAAQDGEAWRKIALEALCAWDGDQDMKLGKLLRAMAHPAFARSYRADIAALHAKPVEPLPLDHPK